MLVFLDFKDFEFQDFRKGRLFSIIAFAVRFRIFHKIPLAARFDF